MSHTALPYPAVYDAWVKTGSPLAPQPRNGIAEDAPPPPAPRDAAGRRLRHDGWTPERQQTFLAAIAEGHSAEHACRLVGLSPASAYALRTRAAGQAFALGWRAANLHAREALADRLLARAVDGYTETITRADGAVIERHRFDNRLACSMLARLDRQADAVEPGIAAANAAARLVAAEFDQFLDLIGRDDGGANARAGLFLAARGGDPAADAPADPVAADLVGVSRLARADRYVRGGAGLPAEVEAADLDPAARAGWTAEQWARADAAGLIAVAAPAATDPADPVEDSQHPQLVDSEDELLSVWFDEDAHEWRTDFPPPEGFVGAESGDWADDGYHRTLAPDELALVEAEEEARTALRHHAATARREEWFADCRTDTAALIAAAEPTPQPEDAPNPPSRLREGPGVGRAASPDPADLPTNPPNSRACPTEQPPRAARSVPTPA